MKKTRQTSDLKVGQKVWVDNLEEDRLETWTVKKVRRKYVSAANQEKEVFRFHEEDGEFVFVDKGTDFISYVLYKNEKEAKRGRKKGASTIELFFYLGLLNRYLCFGMDASENPIFAFRSDSDFSSHGCEIFLHCLYFGSKSGELG